jgi:hypothetical protein
MLLRCLGEGLFRFGRVDAGQPDRVPVPAAITDRDGVAVGDGDYPACKRIGAQRRSRQQQTENKQATNHGHHDSGRSENESLPQLPPDAPKVGAGDTAAGWAPAAGFVLMPPTLWAGRPSSAPRW